VLREDSVLLVVSRRSALDHCLLPAGIRLFVSSVQSESDLLKTSESMKRVAKSVFPGNS
jgi:serine palmitoyltransferase